MTSPAKPPRCAPSALLYPITFFYIFPPLSPLSRFPFLPPPSDLHFPFRSPFAAGRRGAPGGGPGRSGLARGVAARGRSVAGGPAARLHGGGAAAERDVGGAVARAPGGAAVGRRAQVWVCGWYGEEEWKAGVCVGEGAVAR
eukprot:354831-Chlamydomonas_euryale.AAC.3